MHLGDVAQTNLTAAAATNRHLAQLLDAGELAAHAHLHHVLRRVDRAGAFDRVLRAQLLQHTVEIQPHLREALLRNLDPDLLVLHAELVDLGNILHAQQLLARLVGEVLELGVAIAIAVQRVDHAEHVAEVIVEERPLDIAGQGVAHVADLLAHRVPDVGDLRGLGGVLDLEDDLRLARFGIAADLVRIRHFLQRAFDLVGDLLGHLLRGRAGPVGAHHHRAERERRVFVLAELEIGGKAQQHQHHHQVARERGVFERPFREVEMLLFRNVRGRVFCRHARAPDRY